MKVLFLLAALVAVAFADCPANAPPLETSTQTCCLGRFNAQCTPASSSGDTTTTGTCCPSGTKCCSPDGVQGLVDNFICCPGGTDCLPGPSGLNECVSTGPTPTAPPTRPPTVPGECRDGSQPVVTPQGQRWTAPCPDGTHVETFSGDGSGTFCCTTKAGSAAQCGNQVNCQSCIADSSCTFVPTDGCVEATTVNPTTCVSPDCVVEGGVCPEVQLAGTCWNRCGVKGWGKQPTRNIFGYYNPFNGYGSDNQATQCHCDEECETAFGGNCCTDFHYYC